MHVTGDPVYGSPQTRQSEILNRTFLVLPPTKSCPACVGRCTCRWSSEKSSKGIDFRCIFQNDAEIKERKKFEEKRLYDGLKTVSRIYYLLQNLELSTTDEIDNILETSEDDSVNENDQHQTEADFPPELHLEEVLASVKEGIMTKKEDRGDHTPAIPEEPNFPVKKITLTSIAGTHTDAGLAKAILNDVKKLCLEESEDNDRMFVGGDQKTMEIVLNLKSQWGNELKYFYVVSPDMHYRKSMLHAILTKYSVLGVQHLAKLSGYVTGKQRFYLTNGANISKSFGFIERLCDSMRIIYIY